MADPHVPSQKILAATIHACLVNGERLCDQSYDLEFRDPPSLQLYVLMIAQEEFAKAFMLFLVQQGIIPFSRPLLRAMNDHACKQLVGLIMDYVIMRWDTLEEAEELIRADADLGDKLPHAIQSAIVLLRFEKIGRWESNSWEWNDEPQFDPATKKTAQGQEDRRKQDALYVRIGGDGRVCLAPAVTQRDIDENNERASNFRLLIRGLVEGDRNTYRYDRAVSFIQTIFAEPI